MAKKCCVIGAGVSGLTSIKHLLEVGIEPVCYEKDDDIGGIWEDPETRRDDPGMYSSCIMNTSKEMSCFSDFPVPKEFPNFMRRHEWKKYLDMYVEHFWLRQYIQLKTYVVKVKKGDNFEDNGQWMVTTKEITSNKERTEKFDFILACNGHLCEPNIPPVSGLDSFKGKVLHSYNYRDFRGFENKRVLVVGTGSSASDVACDLSHHASQVYMSTRHGTYCIQRTTKYGLPFDHVALARYQQALPSSLMRPFHFRRINSRYEHKKYGLSPNTSFKSAEVTITDDLPNRVLYGTIILHDMVVRFTEHGAEFKDGSSVDNIDAVIFGTGYNFSFPFLEESVVKMDNYVACLYMLVWPVDLNPCTLAVIGLVQPLGALAPAIEMQARWAAQVFSGKCTLPSMSQRLLAVEKWRNAVKTRKADAIRYGIRILFIRYMDQIAQFIQCRPHLLNLFFSDPKLWYRIFFGPATPAQWRLEGTGKWAGAKQAIEQVQEKTWYPMKTRKAGEREREDLYVGWISLFKKVAIILFCIIVYKTFLHK